MPTRIKKTRLCVFLMLTCGYSSVTVAENSSNETVADNELTQQDASNRTPIVRYKSVFDNYIPFDHVPDISWQEANDNVGQFGGWRAYAELVQGEVMKEKEAMAEEGAMKEKEAMSDEGVMKEKDAISEEGVMTDKEAMEEVEQENQLKEGDEE